MSRKIAGTLVTVFIVLGTVGLLFTNFFTKTPVKLPDIKHPLGWIAIASCLLAFGSYGMFIKTPAVSDLEVDPAVFQVCWVVTQLLGFVAINSIGYAVGPAIWGGTTMVVSFVWGISMLGDRPKSMPLSVVALGIVIVGITTAAVCNSALLDKLYLHCLSPERREERQRVFDSVSVSVSANHDFFESQEHSPEETISMFCYSVGIVCAILLGLLNGSLQVPFYYYRKQIGKTNYDDSISYLLNFSAGIVVTTPVICFIWSSDRMLLDEWMSDLLGLINLIIDGLVGQACGYFAATYATLYLGNRVGYPLTQTCIVINGLWGIIYYKEIRGAHKIITFMIATVIIIGGAIMLAVYGLSLK